MLEEFLSIELVVFFHLDRGHPNSTLMTWKHSEKLLAGDAVHKSLPGQRTTDLDDNGH